MTQETKTEQREKTPYQKMIGENHDKERVQFVWDQIPEEENLFAPYQTEEAK